MAAGTSSSSNAERALDILLLLAAGSHDGMALSEIAASLGTGKTVTHRSLQALMAKGFAESGTRHGHYRLGASMGLLARAQDRLRPHVARIRPGMVEFTRETGYTTYLMIVAGLDAVCADIVSRHDARRSLMMGVGARVPLGIAGGSLALLSIMDEAEAERVMQANAARYANYPALSEIDVDRIRSHVRDARRRGFSVNFGLYFLGEGGLGLPLPAAGDSGMDMAVSFSLPVEYMSEAGMAELIARLRKCIDDCIAEQSRNDPVG